MIKHNFFSKGHDGCLVYPAIIDKTKNPEKYITKIGERKNIENEKFIYDNLPEEFNHILYDKECHIGKFVLDKNLFDQKVLQRIEEKKSYNIIYDKFITIKLFNGNDLSKFLYKKIKINKKDVYNILKSLFKLYHYVKKLNLHYKIFHRDITSHNILYNIHDKSIRLVDFVQSRQYFEDKCPSQHEFKDQQDTIDIINKFITFACKNYNVEIKSINTIKDFDKKYIKRILL